MLTQLDKNHLPQQQPKERDTELKGTICRIFAALDHKMTSDIKESRYVEILAAPDNNTAASISSPLRFDSCWDDLFLRWPKQVRRFKALPRDGLVPHPWQTKTASDTTEWTLQS